jgi:hypothetical protein
MLLFLRRTNDPEEEFMKRVEKSRLHPGNNLERKTHDMKGYF